MSRSYKPTWATSGAVYVHQGMTWALNRFVFSSTYSSYLLEFPGEDNYLEYEDKYIRRSA